MATRGRPRSFDRSKALCRAQEIFWAAGYEGATLADLQKAMGGITAPSFYAAFGSKEELFREVIELYRSTEGAAPMRALMESATAREAVEGLLLASAESCTQPGKPRGCMMITGAVNCDESNRGVQEHLREMRGQRPKLIRRRLERGVAEGDVPAGVDLSALTSFIVTMIDGIALQARDGASRSTLKATVRCAMAAWDKLTAQG